MYQFLLFDLDGTLTDSVEGILGTLRYTLEQFGIEETDEKRMISFIGPPLLESLQTHYGMTEPDLQTALITYRDHYRAHGMYQNQLYPGVLATLETLREQGVRMGVATAKGEWTANRVVDHFGLRPYFEFVVANDMKVNRNHKDQIITLALTHLDGLPKEKIVMIGDRQDDILGAHKNGIASVAVTYGYGTIEELRKASPTHFVSHPKEIIDLVGE